MTEATLAKVGALDNVTPETSRPLPGSRNLRLLQRLKTSMRGLRLTVKLKAEKEGRGHKIGF